MATKATKAKARSRSSSRAKPAQNWALIDARRLARQQRELLKVTRRHRRDLATHRRELRMLWMDLNRQFADPLPAEETADTLEDDREPATV